MRCAVTMVSNVSDRSDAWRGVLLHAHMSEQKCHMEWATRRFAPSRVDPCTHACMHADRCQHQRVGGCIRALIYQEYISKSAKKVACVRTKQLQLPVCEGDFLLLRCKKQPVSQDIDQSDMSRLNAGS